MKFFPLLLYGPCGLCGSTARPVADRVHLLAGLPAELAELAERKKGTAEHAEHAEEKGTRFPSLLGALASSSLCVSFGAREVNAKHTTSQTTDR